MSRQLSREDVERLAQELEMVEQLALSMQRQLDMVVSAIDDMNDAISSIKLVENPPSETLIHIGGSTYVRGTIQENSSLIVAIGAGYYIEVDSGLARTMLEARVKELEETRKNLEENIARLVERASQIRQFLGSLMRTQ